MTGTPNEIFYVAPFQFNGTIMSKDWVEDYVRTNAKQLHIRSVGCDIQSLTVGADTAVCSVCGSEAR